MPYKDPEVKRLKQNEYTKRWQIANRDKYLQGKKNNRIKNKDKIKIYRRQYAIKTLYNLTENEYQALLLKQDGKCAICGSSNPRGNKFSNHFQVDHDHQTNEVRGLLCAKCNRGLGLLGDNINSIEKVLLYLKGENEYNATFSA